MQAIPGNKHFQGNVEFSTLINFFFGPVAHVWGQIILYAAIQSNAIQSLVLTAQVLIFNQKSTDQFLVFITGKTCGLSMAFDWICKGNESSPKSPSPFIDTMMIFTFGFLIVLCLCIPLFFVDLDSSISLIVGKLFINRRFDYFHLHGVSMGFGIGY
jgi:hypothetical protein